MKKINPQLLGIAWAIIVLVFVTSMFTASFFLTAYIYKITNLNPPMLLVQIINSLLGLFFAFLILAGVGRFFRSRQIAMQIGAFGPIIDAMERIAKGDSRTQTSCRSARLHPNPRSICPKG